MRLRAPTRAQARRTRAARAAGVGPALASATITSAIIASVASVTAVPAAHAQGFGLNEIGGCAVARAGAVTGAPCEDASVVYWNPAAAAALPRGRSAYVGASAIAVRGYFRQDYTARRFDGDVPVEVPPFLGATWTGGREHKVSFGLAAYVPYGLTSQWRDDFVGRFAAQRASLQSIYVQPNLAVEIVPGRLMIGGGPVIGYSRLELRQALDAAALPSPLGGTLGGLGLVAEGTEFGRFGVKGSGTAFGANLGIFARPTNTLSVGVRFLSELTFRYDNADATFTPSANAANVVYPAGIPNPVAPGTFLLPPGGNLGQLLAGQFAGPTGAFRPGQQASTRITHPAQLQVGLGWNLTPRTLVSADYARVEWQAFDRLPVDFGAGSPLTRSLIEQYEPSNSYRLSVDHSYRSGWAARAGFSYATAAAPDVSVTPLLPDMDRYNFAAGAGIPLGPVILDASYLRVETRGRRGRTGERLDLALPAEQLNSGWYALNANVFSVSLKARF